MADNPPPTGAAEECADPPAAGNSAVQALADSLRMRGTAQGNLSSLNSAIGSLKAEQARLKEEKKRLAKELKNQQRRKRRLKSSARQLSNEDLLAVLMMRE